MSLDWLIVGGGIHGVHIAARLIGEADVGSDRSRIVDPEDRLLARWRRCTATTGMTHLRSSSVHHLDRAPGSLQRFAGKRRTRRVSPFSMPYSRPSLELFNAHCDRVIETLGLADLHFADRVVRCEVDCMSVRAQLGSGQSVEAKNVVLALGSSDEPRWPDWAREPSSPVHHIFEPDFDGWPPGEAESIAVVGGGISACQVALRLHREGHFVHLVSRHPIRQHQFDSDPGWLGPKLMTGFERVRDPDRRRTIISGARHRGSVPPDVHRALRRAMAGPRLLRHEDEATGLWSQGREARLRLRTGRTLDVNRVLLATGFSPSRPGGSMVDELIASTGLPCASCGYPVVDTRLRWHPRIYVSGPLAELELGPAARNIAGARRAADRLVPEARRSESRASLA